MTKNKKIVAAIAAAVVAATTSVTAFATLYSYHLVSKETLERIPFKADNNYMLFNTRPSSPGPVELTIDGDGLIAPVHATFPAQVSRAPEVIYTKDYIGKYYYATLYNPSDYSISGVLEVKTSATKY